MSLTRVRDLNAEAERLAAKGDAAGALAAAREATEVCRQAPGIHHYAYPLVLASLGWLEHASGHVAAADALFKECEEKGHRLAETDFEHARAALTHVADYWAARGERGEARRLLGEVLDLTGATLGVDHPRYFAARERLAQFVAASPPP